MNRRHTDTVKLLLVRGADVNIQDHFGQTALICAAVYGWAETVKMLLDARADIDIQDKFGRTALMMAAAWGHTRIMELLMQAGADISIGDNDGKTAFDMLKENHPQEYDKWISDTARKLRKKNLKREDSTRSQSCTPDYEI